MCPKIHSLLDCFVELNTDLAILTETWLTDGDGLQEDIDDLREGSGLGLLVRNREPGARGTSHGGVAIAFRQSTCTFKPLKFSNPESFEVMAAIGNIPGHIRKMVAIAAYMPPGDAVGRGKACMEFVQNLIIKYKRKYNDPYFVLAGDFNQWKMEEYLEDFLDVKEVPVGNTRGDNCIDRIFTNIMESVTEAGTLPPLESEDGKLSDHKIAYSICKIKRAAATKWVSYSYRYYNPESEALFKQWVVLNDWSSVLGAVGSNAKTEAYQAEITDAIESFSR